MLRPLLRFRCSEPKNSHFLRRQARISMDCPELEVSGLQVVDGIGIEYFTCSVISTTDQTCGRDDTPWLFWA